MPTITTMMPQISIDHATQITKAYIGQDQSPHSKALFGDMTDGIKVTGTRHLDLGFEKVVRVSLTYPEWADFREGELSIPLNFWIQTQAQMELEQYLQVA